MKFIKPHPFSDPDAAARKLVEIRQRRRGGHGRRIYIELVNAPFLAAGGSGDDFRDGIARAIGRGMKLYPSVPLSSRVRSSH